MTENQKSINELFGLIDTLMNRLSNDNQSIAIKELDKYPLISRENIEKYVSFLKNLDNFEHFQGFCLNFCKKPLYLKSSGGTNKL